jgi:TetR/AcrR family transcriptional regulator, transcriptional repressor for nem operon
MNNKTTREQIIDAADELFYQRGFEHTSFADIASAVNISRGNFYHHFKAKDDILAAVIEQRLAKTGELLAAWETTSHSPVDRIRSFVAMLIGNREPIMRFGCPVGTLCAELAKLNHTAQADANRLFTLFREWLSRQFSLLGHAAEADDLAMHLLMRSQGIATLAQAFHDEAFLRREVEGLNQWLNSQLQHSHNWFLTPA